MPRARNIKPGFFTNDKITEMSMAARLLFIGLWTIADREGRLEDRPKKIKIDIFPVDDINVDALLNELDRQGFIVRYQVEDLRCIQIVNFTKHQNPHKNEVASEIPEFAGVRAKERVLPEPHPSAPSSRVPTESISGFLNPDSGLLIEDGEKPAQAPPPTQQESEPPSEPPKKQAKAPREERETKAPATFELTDEHYEYGAKYEFTAQEVEQETEKFLNWARSKGKKYINWQAAWKNWILQAKRYRDEARAKIRAIGARGQPIETYNGSPIYDHRGNPTAAYFLKQADELAADERTSA